MKSKASTRPLTFQSKLERIAKGMEYYAISVPLKITEALGSRAAVPVRARFNDSPEFPVSLYPVGGGRHYLRIKASIRKAAGLEGEGARVRVRMTVRDRAAEVVIPPDLAKALRAEGVREVFAKMPPGEATFLLRRIEEAAKPETRAKRIQAAVEAAHARREKSSGRGR